MYGRTVRVVTMLFPLFYGLLSCPFSSILWYPFTLIQTLSKVKKKGKTALAPDRQYRSNRSEYNARTYVHSKTEIERKKENEKHRERDWKKEWMKIGKKIFISSYLLCLAILLLSLSLCNCFAEPLTNVNFNTNTRIHVNWNVLTRWNRTQLELEMNSKTKRTGKNEN